MHHKSLPLAPLYAEIAQAPSDARAFWLTTADDIRIRAAIWGRANASAAKGTAAKNSTAKAIAAQATATQDSLPKDTAKGTVLLFPGRTECIEKYGLAAQDLAQRGYASAIVDWRGQGLSQRLIANRLIGHVTEFSAYQHDVRAFMAFIQHQDLPRPFYLLAHSMGGAIGLRALIEGLEVQAAVFSAPMWGISMRDWQRPLADAAAQASGWLNQDHRLVPGTSRESYIRNTPFKGNRLTHDPEMWAYMRRQLNAHSDLRLAGPSLGWLRAALQEIHLLAAAPAPAYPALATVGSEEQIVSQTAIHARMQDWPQGKVLQFRGAAHEVMMERPTDRAHFFDAATALFAQHR